MVVDGLRLKYFRIVSFQDIAWLLGFDCYGYVSWEGDIESSVQVYFFVFPILQYNTNFIKGKFISGFNFYLYKYVFKYQDVITLRLRRLYNLDTISIF